MTTIKHKRITRPGQLGDEFTGDDGLGMYREGKAYTVEDCIIDLSDCDIDDVDEAGAVTWGASATCRRCVIRGAGKLFLCGSGDEHKGDAERDKRVQFFDCILEDGGRRFPEVQDGMHVQMKNCLIRNWGAPDRFDTRSFGAWAHKGGSITAIDCVFWQDKFLRPVGQFVTDIANHIGWAVSNYGIASLFRGTTYLPGVCRGLMAGPDGDVSAINCYRNHRWIRLEGRCSAMMDETDAKIMIVNLQTMAAELDASLPK